TQQIVRASLTLAEDVLGRKISHSNGRNIVQRALSILPSDREKGSHFAGSTSEYPQNAPLSPSPERQRSVQSTSAARGSGLPKRCAVMLTACSRRNGSSSTRPDLVTSPSKTAMSGRPPAAWSSTDAAAPSSRTR